MVCSICLNSIKIQDKKTLVCEHSFCKTCIEKWELKSNTCPCCRVKIQNLNKLCTMCKYGCNECKPTLETIMNDIEEYMRNKHNDALRETLYLLDFCQSIVDH